MNDFVRERLTREELLPRSRGELFEFCRDEGIKASNADTKEILVEKLLAYWAGANDRAKNAPSPSFDPSEPLPSKQPDKPMIPEGKLLTLDGKKINGKKYRVTVFSTEHDKADVALAINGYAIKIQRNKEVVLDECWVEDLRNSMISTVEQDPETGAMMPITRLTYPHQAIPV